MSESIIVCLLAAFFLWGIGYLITQDANRLLTFKQQCIESGMQYMNGDCIR